MLYATTFFVFLQEFPLISAFFPDKSTSFCYHSSQRSVKQYEYFKNNYI